MSREKTTANELVFFKMESELAEGMKLKKCLQCGCMKEELEQVIELPQTPEDLKQKASEWLTQMEPIRYACLGCDYCYPAVAANVLATAFPNQIQGSSCGFEEKENQWPPVVGEYFILDPSAPIAISTLASTELAKEISEQKFSGVSIVGKTETENIGIDKVIKNVISNQAIRSILLVGTDPAGHLPGATLLALSQNGVDENQRIVGSPGRRPFLRNTTKEDITQFRSQVRLIDRIGLTDSNVIAVEVADVLGRNLSRSSCCGNSGECMPGVSNTETVLAQEPEKIEMDRAGYFVILPIRQSGKIVVEHYSYDDKLQRIIEGITARSIYSTIISNGWVSKLSHAAYLGKELAKAELSLREDLQYIQDGA